MSDRESRKRASKRQAKLKSDQRIATMLNDKLETLVPNIINAIIPNLNLNGSSNGNSNGDASGNGGASENKCTFKHFNSCHPNKFNGTEGATGLLEWFESMENTFINSDCPANLRVRHATGVLQKRALTWWNGEKHAQGTEAALAMSWDDFKIAMTTEFCPRSEMKKLEDVFYHLKQVSGNNVPYNNRYHELSLLIPRMVTPLPLAIEKYIEGPPPQIHDSVMGSKPATVEDAIHLAASLTDKHVKDGTLTRKGTKRPTETTSNPAITEPSQENSASASSSNKKRKAGNQNYAVVAPLNQVPVANPPAAPQTN